ncbi:NLR family CARD domain-containing protein 4 [Holothuria leucospilota]|uniref:NLR family CARD domain-containing protein 4 n=1 Tax=Holothuria leucospilota TaxID=206669 RepID=A0A9Q1CNQ9_HOLLE|nr:NLR family CARD domain-containing protein 4 [Holothuria leucospilota]
MCRRVQPVPFLREQYDIKELFVESRIEFLEDRQKEIRNGKEQWRILQDYKPIFTDLQIKSKMYILDGEPGYGKSTLALQMAHDWCHHTAPMNNFEILVLLRLRQFKNVMSIFTAIKKFLLPKDSPLTEDDVAIILDNASVLILLDGYDEYPDQGNKETDIEYIIRGEMFQKHDVVLMTRTGCLPLQHLCNTQRIRLKGFDQATRNLYIRNVVARGSSEDANEINKFLRNNPVSTDLCQNPLFFAMICHMAYNNDRFYSLSTVTDFFRHIIKCFHSHEVIRNLTGKREIKRVLQNHRALDKMAFEGLSRNTLQISWSRDELREKMTDDLYDEYIRIGILVEEEVYDYDAIDYEIETRFYHKLFLEWYAAHYLADEASNPEVEFEPWPKEFHPWCCNHDQNKTHNRTDDSALFGGQKYLMKSLNPNDVHYLYRFACGLNPKTALKIIDHLGKNEGYDKYTLLCIIEWGGALKEVVNTVTLLCSRRIYICDTDTLQVQNVL